MTDPLFDLDPWRLIENGLDTERIGAVESALTLANGYLGIRGSLDEGEPAYARGTFVAGVYEEHPLSYPEGGYGDPTVGQAIIPVTEGTLIRALVDGIPLSAGDSCLEHQRILDMCAGTLHRHGIWKTRAGGRVQLASTRMVMLDRPSVAAIRYRITALDRPARIALRSELVANSCPAEVDNDDPRVPAAMEAPFDSLVSRLSDGGGVLVHRTHHSEITVAATVRHEVTEGPDRVSLEKSDDAIAADIVADLEEGESLEIVKYLGYSWTRDSETEHTLAISSAAAADAADRGFDGLLDDQRAALDDFWEGAEISLDGDGELEQGLRFCLYQLFQASACLRGAPIGAKGLTGSGYSGHTFWDIEGFVAPVLSFLRPDNAAEMLRWRASTLPHAQQRAEVLGIRGATFAWRTIDGHEVSAYWPASSAAMHINADIARAFVLHSQVTGADLDNIGRLKVLVETARAWASMGHLDANSRWHLLGLTGPDEYTGVVDDNVFTNLMAVRNLRWAADACSAASREAHELGVEREEIESWRRYADLVWIPWDEELGVHPANDNFTMYGEWDFENGPVREIQSQAHYAKIYRRQVLKQADLVQALWWCEDDFTPEEIARDFDYYERRTVRDSSLSAGVQGVVAARLGHLDLAHGYLRETTLCDLRDIQENSYQGLHMASLAGAWNALVCGFGGLREACPDLRLQPRLPKGLTRMAFRFRWHGALIGVETNREGTEVRLLGADAETTEPVEMTIDDTAVRVGAEPQWVPMGETKPLLDPPKQPPTREPSI